MILNTTNSMLFWNPNSDQVKLAEFTEKHRFSKYDEYRFSDLSTADLKQMSYEKRVRYVLTLALHMILCDGVDQKALHRELLQLDEYRAGCTPDMLVLFHR